MGSLQKQLYKLFSSRKKSAPSGGTKRDGSTPSSLAPTLNLDASQTKRSVPTLTPARVIVAVDFGTTFSGFSYAHESAGEQDLAKFFDEVQGYYHWPSQDRVSAEPYCKTQTSLLYTLKHSSEGVTQEFLGSGFQNNSSQGATYELKGWGWSAFEQYNNLLQKSNLEEGKDFHFITKFKLALAPALAGSTMGDDMYKLPEGFTVERVVSDYLRELSKLVLQELREKYGGHFSGREIQWCLTVPAMWDDAPKQKMKKCAELAGLVSEPSYPPGEASPHPIKIVLEPEAASAYCQAHLKKTSFVQTRFLIVDVGGGTVDLVMHEKVSTGADCDRVKEICSGSTGDLCGSTFVDKAFYDLLSRKIPFYDKYISENPTAKYYFGKEWMGFKFSFDGTDEFRLPVQTRFSNRWEKFEKQNGEFRMDSSWYENAQFTVEEMTAVFDRAVNTILELIEDQLSKVGCRVDALLVVGGFSASSYLRKRIRDKFKDKVGEIINPTNPGSAVVVGAVAYGRPGKDIVMARIARKTYGLEVTENQRRQVFSVFVRKGEEVEVDHCEKHQYGARGWVSGQAANLEVDVYSTTNENPSYVTDPGTVNECTFNFAYPAMIEQPLIDVSMFFGRTLIGLTAVGVNFESKDVILPSISFYAGP